MRHFLLLLSKFWVISFLATKTNKTSTNMRNTTYSKVPVGLAYKGNSTPDSRKFVNASADSTKVSKPLGSIGNSRKELKDLDSNCSPKSKVTDMNEFGLSKSESSDDKENLLPSQNEKAAPLEGSKIVSPVRDRPSSCVFVASLTSSLADDQLCVAVTKYFSTWGVLTGVKVLRDPYNRPYAFVQYSNDKDAKKAISEAHNSNLEGRPIRCERAKVNRTLFFSSASAFHESDIRSQLGEYGEIEKVVPSNDKGYILLNPNSKFSKNWYVKFAYREDAIRSFANLKTDNSKWIEWAKNIEEDDDEDESIGEDVPSVDGDIKSIDEKSVFVGQISNDITKEDLIERFSKHGEIEDLVLTKRYMNNFAFIKYKDESSCASAVEKENHSMFKDKTLHVQYKEIHNNVNKNYKRPSKTNDTSKKVFGIELAPPPINLNRKNVNGPSYRRLEPGADSESKHSHQFVRSPNPPFQSRSNLVSFKDDKYKPPNSFLPSSKWNHLVKPEMFPKTDHERGAYNRNFYNYKPRWSKQNGAYITSQPSLDSPHRTQSSSIASEISSDKSVEASSTDVKSEKGNNPKVDAEGTSGTTGTNLSGTNDTADTTVGSGHNTNSNVYGGGNSKRINKPFFYYIPSNEIVANQMQGFMQPMPQPYNPYAYYSAYEIPPPQDYIAQVPGYQYFYPPMSHPSDCLDYQQLEQ